MSADGAFTAVIGDVDPMRFATQMADLIRELTYGPAAMVWRHMPERRHGRHPRYADAPDWTYLWDYAPSPPTDPERIAEIMLRQVTGPQGTVEATAARVLEPYTALTPEIREVAQTRWIQSLHAHLEACVDRFSRQARDWHRNRLLLVEVEIIEDAVRDLEGQLGGKARKRQVHQTQIRRCAYEDWTPIQRILTERARFLSHPDFALSLEATTWTLRRTVLELWAT